MQGDLSEFQSQPSLIMDRRKVVLLSTIDGESQCSGHRPCCDVRGQSSETYGINRPFHCISRRHPCIPQLSGVKRMSLMDRRWTSCQKSPSSIQRINTRKTERSCTNTVHTCLLAFPSSSKNSGTPFESLVPIATKYCLHFNPCMTGPR